MSREVKLNRGRVKYSAEAAHTRADRQRRRPRPRRLAEDGEVRVAVTAGLVAKQSPAAIAADLRAGGGPRVCAETIYQAGYHGCLPVTARECLRTRRPRRRRRQVRHAHRRAGLPNINRRPAAVIDRTEPGHFELDRIYGVP